jgi:hypothetical protein
LMMFVDRGEAEIICSFRVFRILTPLGHWSHWLLTELFVPRAGQYGVFWMGVGWCSLF